MNGINSLSSPLNNLATTASVSQSTSLPNHQSLVTPQSSNSFSITDTFAGQNSVGSNILDMFKQFFGKIMDTIGSALSGLIPGGGQLFSMAKQFLGGLGG